MILESYNSSHNRSIVLDALSDPIVSIRKPLYKQVQSQTILIVIQWAFGIMCPLIMLMTLLAHVKRSTCCTKAETQTPEKGSSKKKTSSRSYIGMCFGDLGSVISGYLSVNSPILGILSEIILGFALVFLIMLMSTDTSKRIVDT
jgi:glycerol uptake facilitator-like aquaporin